MADREKVKKALRACYSADIVWCQAREKGLCDYNVSYCRMALFKDAAELLEAQEPRVLALDEIHSGMTVWLEDEDKAEVILAIVVVPDGICRCFITADNRRISPSNNDYCVRWRAWTSEPTDVQKKAVKWK